MNIRTNTRLLSLLLVAVVWLVAATFPNYPSRPPRECAVSAESGGVVVGAQPMLDPADQQTYFHMKLKGLVPVFIAIQNGSKGDSFIFDKANVKSGPAETGVASPDVTKSRGRQAAGVFVSPLFITHDFKNQQNLLKQEVQSTTLSPGASTHGFLYLPVSNGVTGQKMQLRVVLVKAGSGETSFIDLSF
jgi:hypothetical protein